MSQNLKTVEFVSKRFYKNSSDGMRELCSSTFSFTLNGGEKQSFDQFVARMRVMNSSAQFTLHDPVADDDTHFSAQFEVRIPSDNGEFKTALGKTKFLVENGLLKSIDINYEKSQEEYDEFQQLITVSPIAFV